MEKSKKYLADILAAINLIEDFLIDTPDFLQYEKDRKTQSAVERQLAIIGEALNKSKNLQKSFKIEHEKEIINFRNRLVHSYDSIDNSIVWAIIKKHLNLLKKEVEILLNEFN